MTSPEVELLSEGDSVNELLGLSAQGAAVPCDWLAALRKSISPEPLNL